MVTILAFVVLGGVAVAGVQLAKNSVGTKQLKNSAVTAAKIKAGAVDASKLSSSALSGYAKGSELSGLAKTSDLGGYAQKSDLDGYLKAPVGPDQLGTLPAAGLSGAIYNVSVPGGFDCQGSNADFPDDDADDVDFSTVDFDTAGLVNADPGAVSNCFNGFKVATAGTYLVTAWVAWDANGVGDREIELSSYLPSEGCCNTLAISEQLANSPGNVTSQTVSAIVHSKPNTFISVVGRQDSGGTLGLFGGGLQIARLGN